jgi:hypothetical protein
VTQGRLVQTARLARRALLARLVRLVRRVLLVQTGRRDRPVRKGNHLHFMTT